MFSPWPSFTKEEIHAVSSVLQSNNVNYWTGNECREFEKEFSKWVNVKYSISLANGTIALDLALRSLNIGSLDLNDEKPEVIVTSRSFIASASAIVNVGAVPVFVDVNRDSQNITVETIKASITKKTIAIICVHIAGWPCEMDKINELALANNLYVIEDCAQAHGAKYKGRMVGSYGDIAAWSFCQDKIMSTGGEGGMITTNNESLWRNAWAFKDHGKSYSAVYKKPSNKVYRWLHESFGTNGRMTEMQAVIGRIQLRKMEAWNRSRSLNANSLKEVCDYYPKLLRTPLSPRDSVNAFYKFYTYVKPEGLQGGWTRDKLIEEICSLGVPCFSGACSEIYLESAFDKTTFRPKKRLPIAKELGETSLMFLVHPSLTKKDINKIIEAMHTVFIKATGK